MHCLIKLMNLTYQKCHNLLILNKNCIKGFLVKREIHFVRKFVYIGFHGLSLVHDDFDELSVGFIINARIKIIFIKRSFSFVMRC